MRQQKGFTLIELVVVILILGILAATAAPKFVDLSGDARDAALQGVAGALSSASTINYAGCAVRNHVPLADKCVLVNNCSNAASLLQGGLPTGYSITAAAVSTTNGVTKTDCQVVPATAGTLHSTFSFTAIAAGN